MVPLDVIFQANLIVEYSLAHGTGEGQFLCVDALVNLERKWRFVGFVTNRANVFALLRVDAFMQPESFLGSKLPSAYVTGVLGFTVYGFRVLHQGRFVLQMSAANIANSTFLFAVLALVLDPGEVAEEGIVTEFAALVRSDAFVFVQMKSQSAVLVECGRADGTGKEFSRHWCIGFTMGLVYPEGILAVEVPTANFARENVYFVAFVVLQIMRKFFCCGRP